MFTGGPAFQRDFVNATGNIGNIDNGGKPSPKDCDATSVGE